MAKVNAQLLQAAKERHAQLYRQGVRNLPTLDLKSYSEQRGLKGDRAIRAFNDTLRKFSSASIELYQYVQLNGVWVNKLEAETYKSVQQRALRAALRQGDQEAVAIIKSDNYRTRENFEAKLKVLQRKARPNYYRERYIREFQNIVRDAEQGGIPFPRDKFTLNKGFGRNEIMQANYIHALLANGFFDIANMISQMSSKAFYDQYSSNPDAYELGFYYSEIEHEDQYEILLSLWETGEIPEFDEDELFR